MNAAKAMDALERSLSLCGGDAAEIRLVRRAESLTRFSRNRIHQSVSRVDVSLAFRVIVDGATGMAGTNQLDPGSLAAAAARAEALARQGRPDRDLPPLPAPSEGDPGTAGDEAELPAHDHEHRAGVVADIAARAEGEGAHAHGYVSEVGEEFAVANSRGVRAHHTRGWAGGVVLMEAGGHSGYASGVAGDLRDLDLNLLRDRALAKWDRGRDPMEVEPGDYEVILEPEALRDFLFTLAAGFDGRAVEEGRSFLSGRMGERILSPGISLIDDGSDPRGIPMPFDAEGVPRRRLQLLDGGVPVDVALDSRLAHKQGVEPTGHTLPPDYPVTGAMPANLFVDPGDASIDDMIAGTGRGLLVTRVWYHRVINPRKTLVTGLTRDGTFLIERGRIVGAVHNLRYTDSIVDALSDVDAVGGDLELKQYGPAAILLPAVKLKRLRFSAVTRA